MPYCRMCGKHMGDDFGYCPYCGHKSDSVIFSRMTEGRYEGRHQPSQKITRLTVIFLILFFPIGLTMMWYYKPFSKLIRSLITLLFMAVLMLIFMKVYLEIIFGRFSDLDLDSILGGL